MAMLGTQFKRLIRGPLWAFLGTALVFQSMMDLLSDHLSEDVHKILTWAFSWSLQSLIDHCFPPLISTALGMTGQRLPWIGAAGNDPVGVF